MSGKGDFRRVENIAAINKNYDTLDWNNDKEPEAPKPKLVCVLNPETMEWEWVEEAQDNAEQK
jgi:hypothetical protein